MNLIELAERIGVHGWLHPDELYKLAELAVNRDALEIGSFKGLSAWGMAITAKSLTCVDTFRADDGGQVQGSDLTTLDDFMRAVRRYNHVVVYEMTSEQAVGIVEGDYDMIFIDAMHTYEHIRADIDRWWPRVRAGGVLVLHDYQSRFPDVVRAADETFGPASAGNVVHTMRWIDKP